MYQGLKGGEGFGRVLRVERTLVPVGAEILAGLIPWMAEELVACIAITAAEMNVIVILEQAMLFHDPGDLRTNVGPDNSGRYLGMIVRRHFIADVVDERRHDQLIVRAGALGASGRLQRVAQAANGIAFKRVVEFLQGF